MCWSNMVRDCSHPGSSKISFVIQESLDLASWMCTEENLMQQIKERDPLGRGLVISLQMDFIFVNIINIHLSL